MSIVSDRAKGKKLWAQIEQLSNNASSIYNSAKRELNGDFKTAISQLEQIYNQIKELADQIPMQRDTVTGQDRDRAYRLLDNLRKMIDELRALANQQDRTGMSQGVGLEAFQDNQNLGSLMSSLSAMFPSPYTGNDPQRAALFDLYMQLLGSQQQYAWQRSADDLAYQRTNFDTLLQQYMAAGMSRSAALAAASGGLPTVSGSSVGGSLSPNILGGVSQAQNNAIAAGQLGVAQQNADTQLIGTMGQLHQMQLQYELEREAQDVMLWDQKQKIQAMKDIQQTFNLTYSLHAMHVDVPLEATQSQKTFKDWVRAGHDFYNSVIKGDMQIDADGSIICTLFDANGMTGTVTKCRLTQQELAGYAKVAELYEEIQRHVDSPYYGLLFENFFMSNAGPRAYHQQEDYSELQRHLIAGETARAKLDELLAGLADENLAHDVNNQVSQFFEVTALDDPTRVRIQEKMNDLGLALHNGQISYAYAWTDPTTATEEMGYTPLSLEELLKFGFVDLGYDIDSLYQMRSTLQAAALQTDWTHYKAVFDTQANLDRASVSRSGTQADATEGAAIAIKNTNWLKKASEFEIIWNNCGFSKLAAGIGAVSLGGFKFGTAIMAGKRANRMLQLGEQRVQAQQDMVHQMDLRNRSNRNTQYDVSDFDMPY